MSTATDTTTDTDERTELLRQWSELEPERCEPMGPHYDLTVRDHAFHPWPNDAPVNRAAIQYAVQEAIYARGWGCGLSRAQGGEHWAASVFLPDYEGTNASGPSADIALLQAYLEALRDEAETEG